MERYQVLITDRAGVPVEELENAVVDSATRELWTGEQSVGTMEFTMPTLDAKLKALGEAILLRREVQLWYEGVCWWWGLPVTVPSLDRARTRIGCVGLPWLYHQRIFGPIEKNYLTDPSFEDATLANWTAVNCTKESVTSPVVLGGKAMRLRFPTNADAFARQRVTVTTPSDQAVRYFPAAHFYIDTSVAAFSGVAYEERGIYIERQTTGGALLGTPVFYPIPLSTPVNVPLRIEVDDGIEVPAGSTNVLEMRLYDPNAAIVWDASSLTVQESVATPLSGEDANALIQKVNTYAQDSTRGKSNLNIGFVGSLTGSRIIRAYQFKDVPNIGESLNQFPAEGIADLAVMWATDGRSRWLQVFPGKKGSVRYDLALDLAEGTPEFGWSIDARQTRSAVHALGQGSGSDRETATARDTSALEGLVLEATEFAPPETAVGGLAPLAATELARLRRLVKIPTITVPAAGRLDLVEGDRIPIYANYGLAQASGETWRIQRLTLRPREGLLEHGFAHE